MKLKTLIRAGKYVGIALTGLVVVSCKKDNPKPEPEPKPDPVVTDRTETQSIKDDVYKYYKLYSLWETSIPDYTADPSKFTDQYSSADDVLDALKRLTPAHPAYNDGVLDRFSFMDGVNGYNTGTIAKSPLKMDNNDGFGLYITLTTYQGKYVPVINFVEGGSPAQRLGFKRADIITAINEDRNMAVDKDDESAKSNLLSRVSNLLNSNSISLEVKNEDGKVFKRDLIASTYVIDPLYKDSIYFSAGNNVGYLALSSFEEIEENNINQQKIDAVFKKFEAAQIKSLIVDLRYNGGGYVDASVYVADKIGGAKTKGKLMLTYQVNDYIRKTPSLNKMFQDTKFEGKSNLNLTKVYFLVSYETASAAEMLINVLRPYFGGQIIASEIRTYGKPVGFFPEHLYYNGTEKVTFWPVSFMLRNSQGVSEYWDGLVPDKTEVKDYIFVDFGDQRETMLATALSDAAPSSANRSALRRSNQQNSLADKIMVNIRPDRGMIKKR